TDDQLLFSCGSASCLSPFLARKERQNDTSISKSRSGIACSDCNCGLHNIRNWLRPSDSGEPWRDIQLDRDWWNPGQHGCATQQWRGLPGSDVPNHAGEPCHRLRTTV